jgi:hypothetical protein
MISIYEQEITDYPDKGSSIESPAIGFQEFDSHTFIFFMFKVDGKNE